MANNNNPKCPTPDKLKEAINNEDVTYLCEAAEWLVVFLENRNLYHKRQQLKNKIFKQLCIERGLGEQADKLAKDAMFNHVSNEPPDEEVFAPNFDEKEGQ